MAITVGELKKYLSDCPDDMPVEVVYVDARDLPLDFFEVKSVTKYKGGDRHQISDPTVFLNIDPSRPIDL